MDGAWSEKAAQLVMVGESETTLSDATRALLDRGVSSVLVYSSDFETPESAAALVHSIKTYAGRPVCVAIDHEGGRWVRVRSGFTTLPTMAELGRLGDVRLAEDFGHVIGRELRSIGIDLCLGPVLDVATNPRNPVIGERSLGDDPTLVGDLGTAIVRGMQAEGVAACGKHFPGHGDTQSDSNVKLPVLPHGVARLEDVELRPFSRAVGSRIAAMLVGHILFRALDPKHPASLSRPILYGLLRQKLGYRGFVLVDDIDMGALTSHFTHSEIATLGIAAGADAFLCARAPNSAHALISAIAEGIERGTVLPERVETARRRADALIHRHALGPRDFDAELLAKSGGGALLEKIAALGDAPATER